MIHTKESPDVANLVLNLYPSIFENQTTCFAILINYGIEMMNMYIMVAKPFQPRPAKCGIPPPAKSVFPTIIASGGEFSYQLVRCWPGGYLSSCWWREEQTPVVETFLTMRTFSRYRTG